jgi:transcriptional regulator with XRE-family HTH domain
MSLSGEQKVPQDESRAIASLVREEIARRRMTRQRLADEARISISTLEKALAGRRPFTLATIVRLEGALGLELRRRERPNGTEARAATLPSGIAPDGLGSYARPAVGWIEGAYLTLRPSFGDATAIYAYRTEITWSDRTSSLVFSESDRLDAAFTQSGTVSVPHQSGHIYLVTNRHGQHRLIIVARPTIRGEMHGLLMTLKAGRGAELTPIATPILLAPLAGRGTPEFGRIAPGHASYRGYRELLDRTLQEGYAIVMGR